MAKITRAPPSRSRNQTIPAFSSSYTVVGRPLLAVPPSRHEGKQDGRARRVRKGEGQRKGKAGSERETNYDEEDENEDDDDAHSIWLPRRRGKEERKERKTEGKRLLSLSLSVVERRDRESEAFICRLPSLAVKWIRDVCMPAWRNENSYGNDQGTRRDVWNASRSVAGGACAPLTRSKLHCSPSSKTRGSRCTKYSIHHVAHVLLTLTELLYERSALARGHPCVLPFKRKDRRSVSWMLMAFKSSESCETWRIYARGELWYLYYPRTLREIIPTAIVVTQRFKCSVTARKEARIRRRYQLDSAEHYA